jgi:hypothetical protein
MTGLGSIVETCSMSIFSTGFTAPPLLLMIVDC